MALYRVPLKYQNISSLSPAIDTTRIHQCLQVVYCKENVFFSNLVCNLCHLNKGKKSIHFSNFSGATRRFWERRKMVAMANLRWILIAPRIPDLWWPLRPPRPPIPTASSCPPVPPPLLAQERGSAPWEQMVNTAPYFGFYATVIRIEIVWLFCNFLDLYKPSYSWRKRY